MMHIYYGQDKNNVKFQKLDINADKNIRQIIFDDNHDDILNIILQPSLFEEDFKYVVDDASFLTNKTDQDKNLINSLVESNKNIICFAYDEKIDIKIPKVVYHRVTKFNNLSKQKLITTLLSKMNINFDSLSTRQYFESLIDLDPFAIKNEFTKLTLSTQNNIISQTQIDNLVSVSNNPNIFKMLTFLLQKDKKKLIKLYDDLILSKYQPMDLISIINTQLLNLKIYKLAKSHGWSDNDVVIRLLINQYTIMSYNSLNVQLDGINNLIRELWMLEYNMKHNNINQYLGLKFFLAK